MGAAVRVWAMYSTLHGGIRNAEAAPLKHIELSPDLVVAGSERQGCTDDSDVGR